MVIWRDVTIMVGGRPVAAEVPVVSFNEITRRIEPIVNPRGWAYAHRNRPDYRRKAV